MALVPILGLAVVEEDDRLRIRRRIIRPQRINVFDFPENEFRSMFRVNKFICAELIEKLRPALEIRTCRRNVFSVETKVLCALRFFATGSYQKCVGNDICNSMSQQSVSNNVRKVTEAINNIMEDYIKFPVLESEISMLKKEFFLYSEFPGVIGAIDCTHVAIIAPTDDTIHHEKNYVNRKGFHSVNVQLVCDMRMKILSICARFPGSTHDSYIWKMSRLRDWFVANSAVLKDTWLLGDSGYPLEPWLMTPIEAQTAEENRFNNSHKRGRCVIERCNGTLKSRFRCLLKSRSLNYSPTIAGNIINACVVLHNMCIEHNLQIEEDIEEEDEPFDSGVPESHRRQAAEIRSKLVSFF